MICHGIPKACLASAFLLLFLSPEYLSPQETESASADSAILPVSAEEATSHLTKRVEPVYPPLARMTGTRGSVTLRLTIGVDGKVKSEHIVSGHPFLQQAALDAVRSWQYIPFVKNGKPVEAAVIVGLDFDSKLPRHPPMPFPEIENLKAVVITLNRGTYNLKVAGNETVEYTGFGSVCVEGKHPGHIREEEFKALLDAFRTADYFSLEDEYGGVATDSYATESSITIGNQKKEIGYYFGAPLVLTQLEDTIDRLSHSRKWVNCDSETIPALVAEGVDLRGVDTAVKRLLIGAVSYGDAEVVTDLIRAGIEIRVKDYGERTPLMIAASRGLPNMVETLLKAGADPNAANEGGRTVLMYGASSGSAEVLQMLLKAGARVNKRSKEGNTALMAATAAGNPDLVAQMLSAGANVNVRGWKKTTALLAGSMGELEFADLIMGEPGAVIPDEVVNRAKVVRLLIDAGANVNDVNEEGENALFTIYEDAVRKLVKTRIDINARNNNGETALIATVAPEVAEVLVRAGAKLDLTDPTGQTALMHGAKNNYVENLKVLVKAGANLDLQDNEGSTALMLCAEKGLEDSVAVLVNAHANVNLRDKQGLTALGRIYRAGGGNGRAATERLLLAAGGTE